MNDITGVGDLLVGGSYKSTKGGTFTVIKITSSSNVKIRWDDIHKYETVTTAHHIKNGTIRNPYAPSVFNKGYLGVGHHIAICDRVATPTYGVWMSMIQRCYDVKSLQRYPSYIGCSVCDEWLNFQTFAEWYINTGYYNLGYHLDKDILVSGNKIYSPSTCCMVPAVINLLFTIKFNKDRTLPKGVYRNGDNYCAQVSGKSSGINCGTYQTVPEAHAAYCRAKEEHFKSIAKSWQGSIDPRVYNILINWREPR